MLKSVKCILYNNLIHNKVIENGSKHLLSVQYKLDNVFCPITETIERICIQIRETIYCFEVVEWGVGVTQGCKLIPMKYAMQRGKITFLFLFVMKCIAISYKGEKRVHVSIYQLRLQVPFKNIPSILYWKFRKVYLRKYSLKHSMSRYRGAEALDRVQFLVS